MGADGSLYFSLINVEGYRGRNFKLVMQPQGKYSIFVMEGNTGKTTLIELLRWCFKYPQSKAEGKFRHMFTEPAHVLDWDYPNKKQNCKIEIHFSKNGHDYMFRRTTDGAYSQEKVSEGEIGDNISKIEDVIEVDRGADVFRGDDAHKVLTELGITASADYFLFDGERAREYMRFASDRSKVQELVDAVDKRATPRSLVEYSRELNELEERVFQELGSRTTGRGLSRVLNRLHDLGLELGNARREKSRLEDEIGALERTAKQLEESIDELNDKIIGVKSENLNQITILNNEIKKNKERISRERSTLYETFLKLISHVSDKEVINKIKTKIRERGKLPEPYRKDLINLCLEANPPSCHICGRELDKKSKERIKLLGKQVAPHNVQVFLSSDISYETTPFDSKKYLEMEKLLEELENKEKQLDRVQLSSEEKNLIKERDKRLALVYQHRENLGDLRGDLDVCNGEIRRLEGEEKELKKKSKLLKEYRIILDEIEDAQRIIEETKKEIKKYTINVISETIGKSVKSILGPRFSAKLTEDSLYLGENEVFHPEVGGMSGRLVLAYCFAEGMTRVEPMIIDTPVGKMDVSQREQLAEHLKANHKQVILLCLLTELDYFASALSPKKTEIQNKGESVTWLKS